MSLLFIDSFDHYERRSMDKKWSFVDCFWIAGADTWSLHVGAGRDGSTALQFIPRTNSATGAIARYRSGSAITGVVRRDRLRARLEKG